MKAGRFAGVGLLFLAASACTPGSSGPEPTAHATAAPPPAASASAPGVPDLVPGVSIGPVRVGMTRADLEALGLPVKPGPLSTNVTVGPYVASLDGDHVASVFVELRALPAGARVAGAVFDATAKIEAIAAKLKGCGAVQVNEGANVIACEGGRALVIAGGPTGVVGLEVVSAERATPSGAASEATWTHPTAALSFRYPDKLLRVQQKPDGATLTSDVLGTIEDRSGQGKDQPAAFTITISVRVGKLLDVMKSNPAVPVATLFPNGDEASFKEQKEFAERVTVAGSKGYRIEIGSHDVFEDLVYAPLKSGTTLEVVCGYVGDMAKPKVPMAVQKRACDRVLETLTFKQ